MNIKKNYKETASSENISVLEEFWNSEYKYCAVRMQTLRRDNLSPPRSMK
jgi:hypothetical protein